MTNLLHLFPRLDQLLIDVLSELKPAQWQRKTVCKNWRVKDIVAHLLDGSLKRLSIGRDRYSDHSMSLKNDSDLLEYINFQNKTWVDAAKRLSPTLLISLLKQAQNEVIDYFHTLDPYETAIFPVSWAGQHSSENWLDIAREYTERWLHQEQIRQAVGSESLRSEIFYKPFIEICMTALPYHYNKLVADPGKSVHVKIVGDSGGDWYIKSTSGSWILSDEIECTTQVYIDQNIAWLIFSGGIQSGEAFQYWQVIGDQALGQHMLNMRTFIV